jgi:valyl-tRNA synthetase
MAELYMRTGEKFKKLLTFNGDALDDLVLYHPLNEKDVSIIINNEVTNDYGTGINCVCPAHDLDSLKLAYVYGLNK